MRQLKCKHFSIAFILSSSGSAGAELRRMNPPTNSCGICGCGIISSQTNSKAVCKAPKRRFCPAGAGNVRTLYHKFEKGWAFFAAFAAVVDCVHGIYGIITSRRKPKPCFTSLRTPERTFYHNLGLSPLRLRRSLCFAQ